MITTAMLNEGDPDDDGIELTYTITSNVTNGTLRLNGTAIGLNDTFTQADIDAGLVTYDHNGSETLSDSFNFSLADGGENGSTPATGAFNFTVTPVNDAPSGTDGTITATEGVDYVFSSGDFGFSDVDGDNIQGVIFTSLPTHGILYVDANDDGIVDAGEVISASDLVSVPNIDTFSRLKYHADHIDASGTGYATFTFQVRDDGGTANGGVNVDPTPNTMTIDITNINDLPQIIGTTIITNGTFNSNTSGWTVTGNTDWNSGEVRFGQIGGANGTISQTFTTTIGQTYYVSFDYGDKSASASQQLDINVTGSSELLSVWVDSGVSESTLTRYTYRFVADSASTTLTFSDISASHSGVRGYLDNVAVQLASAPTLGALTYTENDSPTAVDSAMELGDLDDLNLESATIQITGNYVSAEDVLTATDQFGITSSWNSTNGTLTLTGTATVDQYETVLRSVRYENTSEDPTASIRTVTMVVKDGDGNSNSQTRDINVVSVNDAPVLDNTGTMSLVSITEDDINNNGNSVAEILASAGGDRLTDVDGAGEGIAITTRNNGNGQWQYQLDGGTWLTSALSVNRKPCC
ncbi:MAG: cadherin-like domain-containing protein [Pirellulaceae bacterium]